MSELAPIRFGIVGCGGIGPTHAGAIKQIPDAELVACSDVVLERLDRMATKYEIPKQYPSFDDLIADPEIDAICVCTPSGMHAAQTVDALRAGKHVISEKPMDVSLEACDSMIAAQRETGKTLAVVSQHRFDPATRLVRELIVSGKLGQIVFATASVHWWRTQQYYDSGDWRGTWQWDGGGALMNQGVHTVDVLQYLAGDVRNVYAQTRTLAHERIEVEDIAALTLAFVNGAAGTITATTTAFPGFPVQIMVCGTEGTAVLEGDRLKQISLKDGTTYESEAAAAHAISVAQGGTASVQHNAEARLAPTAATAASDPGLVWGDAHREQIEDFIGAIREKRRPLMDGLEARKPVAVILAAYRSAQAGLPVNVNHTS